MAVLLQRSPLGKQPQPEITFEEIKAWFYFLAQ
jgi:hypothetical protein